MSGERFVTMTPVFDSLADDELALVEVENMARTTDWEEAVTRAGGRSLGEPTVTREPNPNYGRTLVDGMGIPVLGEDGEPLVDHVKLHVFARGWAER